MKKLASLLILAIAYGLITVSAFILSQYWQEQYKKEHDISKYVTMVEEELIPQDTIDSWDVFYLALTFIESSWNPEALNPSSGALGLIQAMPEGTCGFVDEANRLIGYRKYDNSSRTDPEANRQMFDIVNYYRNPNLDFDYAIQLHNPGADPSYSRNIMNKYNELREYYIRHDTILYIDTKASIERTLQSV